MSTWFFSQVMFEIRDRYFGTMKNAGGQSAVHVCLLEYLQKVLHCAGASRCDQRHVAYRTYGGKLLDVVALAHAILVHTVKDDLSGTALLHFGNPVQCEPLRGNCSCRIAGILVHEIIMVFFAAVDTDYDALRSETFGQLGYQRGFRQSGGVDRDLVCALVQHILGIGYAADTAGNAERYVEYPGDLCYPASIDASVVRARRDVVKNQFVGAFGTIAFCQFENIADHAVITKLHAFDDHTVAYVEAGNYALRRNDATSVVVISPSSNARPEIAAGMPCDRSCCKSPMLRTPPDACSCKSG